MTPVKSHPLPAVWPMPTSPKKPVQVRVVSVPFSPYASSNTSVSTLNLDDWDGQLSRSVPNCPLRVGASGSRFVEHLDTFADEKPALPATVIQGGAMAKAKATLASWLSRGTMLLKQGMMRATSKFWVAFGYFGRLLN